MSQASELIAQQFKDGGVIPADLVGQGSVSKTYVDDQLAIRDQNIANVAGAVGSAQSDIAQHKVSPTAHPAQNITYGSSNVKQALDDGKNNLDNHKLSTMAHSAQNITYSGSVSGVTNVKEAIESVKTSLDLAVISGDSGPAADQARYSTPQAKLYDSLKDRLDAFDVQLTETANANAIINGNFDVWQRATNTNMVSMQYVADRWQNVLISSVSDPSVLTVNRMPCQDLPGSAYYMRFEITNPGSDLVNYSRCNMMQAIEHGVRKLAGAGKKVTLSFWARTNITGKLIGVNLHQDYGTGGTPSTYENIYGRYFELSAEWQQFTHTFETKTLEGKTFGWNNNDVLTPQIWLMWGDDYKVRFGTSGPETFRSAGYIDIAQIQLNSGDTALPFQSRRIGDEINTCQRYFKKSVVNFVYSNVDKIYTAMVGWGRPMRIPPTITLGTLLGTYGTDLGITATVLQQDENGIKTILLSDLPVLNQTINCEISADAEY